MSCSIRRNEVLAEFNDILLKWEDFVGPNETKGGYLDGVVWSLFNNTDYAVVNTLPPLYPLIPANIYLVVQILLLDALVIGYYRKQRTKFVPMMYLIISSCDMLMGVGHLLEYLFLHFLCVDKIGEISFWWSISISMSMVTLANYLSIFSNMVLALCRTINTVRPFYEIKPKLVIFAMMCFLLACVGLLVYDHVRTFKLFYPWIDSISFVIMYPILGIELRHTWFIFPVLGVPFLIPSAIVILCFTIQTRLILCKPAVVTSETGSVTARNNRHVTITVLLLTVLFILCHTTFTVIVCLMSLAEDNSEAYTVDDMGPIAKMVAGTFGVFCCTTLPLINAAFSPVIIICRCSGLRRGLKNMVLACWRRYMLRQRERTSLRSYLNSGTMHDLKRM